MTYYMTLKYIHILSSTLLFGTGLGIAFFMWAAHKSNNIHLIAETAKRVVWADALFTAPAVFVQLITGLLMTRVLHMPLSIFWIKSSLFLFFVTGLCWVPVLFLQMRARNLAQKALLEKTPLPENYYRTMRLWFVLGWPAFLSVLAIFFLMVHKPVL